MKKIRWQIWRKVLYLKTNLRKFKHWSNLVSGEGDGILDPSAHKDTWEKFIILVPNGNLDTEFRPGFYSEKFDICKVSSRVREISDGPFAMRMGPDDCHFFVVGTDKVELEIAGYIKKDLWLY